MQKFDDFLKEQLKDPELKTEYDALETEFDAAQTDIDKSKKLYYEEMAKNYGLDYDGVCTIPLPLYKNRQNTTPNDDFSYFKLKKGGSFYKKGSGSSIRYIIIDYDHDCNVWAVDANSKNKLFRRVYKFTATRLSKNYTW